MLKQFLLKKKEIELECVENVLSRMEETMRGMNAIETLARFETIMNMLWEKDVLENEIKKLKLSK